MKYGSRKRGHKKGKRTLRTKRRQRGGYGPGQNPVGYAWSSDPMTWPGVLAANGANTHGVAMSNYLPLSPYGVATGGVEIAVPEVGYKGGAKHRRRHRTKKGGRRNRKTYKVKSHRRTRGLRGGFGPQELINFGRDLSFQTRTAFDSFMGNQPPVNPSPLDQPINENYKVIEPTPINLPRSFTLAGQSVAPL